MMQEKTLAEILQIEDSAELLAICCPDTGIPLWTTIRHAFLVLIMGDLLYDSPIVKMEGALRSGTRLKAVTAISKSFVHNAIRLRSIDQEYPVALMATGARLLKREGRYFNSLSDYFVTTAPDQTLVIEDLFGWQWPFPRENSNVLIHTPLRVEGELRGRFREGRYRELARGLVDLVSLRAKDLLDWNIGDVRCRWLEKRCSNGAASLLPRYQTYQSIFRKMGARLLIKEEACYGGADNATAMLGARHLGMVTAEYQHGAVSSGHIAYNFAPAVSATEAYRQILPDYFLAYGSWWGEQINTPVKKIALGNPHRDETLAFAPTDNTHRAQILILGDGIETAVYLELCARLSVALGNTFEVIFRPHPLERASVWDKHPDGFVGAVRVDACKDIYSSFQLAKAVVSEVSTGLFEAIGLVPKVFIWDTPKARFGYPLHPFQVFSDATELAHLVLDESAGQVGVQQMESIWTPNWKRNYLNFLDEVLPQ
jgi:hypothetical protein